MRGWDPSLIVFRLAGSGLVGVFGGRDDLDMGAVVEGGGSGGDDLLACGEAGEDLDLACVDDASVDGGLVGDSVGADDHDGGFAGGGDDDGFRGNDDSFGSGAACDGDVDGGAGAETALGIFETDPDFDGGAARIEGGADEGDFAGDRIGEPRDGDRGGIAGLQQLCLWLWQMDFRQQGGSIHDGDKGRAGGYGFSGVEGAVSDDAGDGAANFGVAEGGFGSLVFAAGRFELAFRSFDGGFAADLLHGVEMLLGGFEGGLSLDEGGLGGIEVAARDGSLGEELFAAGDDALVEVEIRFGLSQVELGFLVILRNLGLDLGLVGGIGGVEGALIVSNGSGEVAVLESSEELACFYVGTALDVELFDRGGDLRRDGGFGNGGEDGVGGDVFGEGLDLGGCGLDGDGGGLGSFFF